MNETKAKHKTLEHDLVDNINPVEIVEKNLSPLMQKLITHPIFTSIRSIRDLKVFSQYHVFAVWDFMSLVKTLQTEITCVRIPWVPSEYSVASHLINKIVTEEESDRTSDGRYISHFAYYLEAMEECGADTIPIRQFIDGIKKGIPLNDLLEAPQIPPPSRRFVHSTFDILKQDLHKVLSAFVFGRENIMSQVFYVLLENLKTSLSDTNRIEKFCYYFKRHIELDEDSHAPEGKKLLTLICGNSDQKWQDVEEAAIFSLQARLDLLDDIYQALQKNSIETDPILVE